eukprot:CAMPEP_0170510492 /NCGR_PEP_ID=MMETSP0208-20121228/65794_1 /TAXON_ID=197538 /ORGANISM="Strombidium inclinatum, Strain S3" /LENGTH=38 /DNA_ID= /DNA_START= /DNA_END= /DNA_ORIENTATION=
MMKNSLQNLITQTYVKEVGMKKPSPKVITSPRHDEEYD